MNAVRTLAALALAGILPVLAGAAELDAKSVTYQLPPDIKWQKTAAGGESVVVQGNPSQPGIYVQLIRWAPGTGSRPHFHNQDRYITVISGTWYKGTGTKYDPDSMVAMPAGTFIVDHANGVHYDGAKGEMAVIQIVGMGPVSTTQAEEK
jgi:hypothetical protein